MQGTRRYGSDEAEPIDWIVPPFSESKPGSAITSVGLSEMFAYHATTMANTIKSSLLVFSRKVCSLAGCASQNFLSGHAKYCLGFKMIFARYVTWKGDVDPSCALGQ